MIRLCKCHGVPMDRNPGSVGGWACPVKRRERQRAYYHRVKDTPHYQICRQFRESGRIRVR